MISHVPISVLVSLLSSACTILPLLQNEHPQCTWTGLRLPIVSVGIEANYKENGWMVIRVGG